jgi:signal transduction histidine kinase
MTRLEEGRKELLAREHAARASAEEANRLKDQFLATVSHELRTPLNAILGWSEMLRSGRLDPARRDRANQVIYASATRQAGLIEELLDVARIMSGKLRLERTVIDVADVVRSALQVVQPLAEAKQIHVGLDADASPYGVYGDGARLQQVTWNLLSNAIKFTPDRSAVHVRLSRTDDEIEIVVSDSGQGIAPEFLPHVFEMFAQGHEALEESRGGLGIGLTLVKRVVQLHAQERAACRVERRVPEFLAVQIVLRGFSQIHVRDQDGACIGQARMTELAVNALWISYRQDKLALDLVTYDNGCQ